MNDILDLISKIGEAENSIQDRIFVSPIFFNDFVATKIEGIVYKFKINTPAIPDWYQIRPIDKKTAIAYKAAELQDIEFYLNKLQKIRLILLMRKKNVYLAIPEKTNNLKLPIENPIPVYLFEDTVKDFDRIIARFDGANFWYHQIDVSNDPTKSAYLRDQLVKIEDPKKISYSGLTFEERLAYSLRFILDKKIVIDKKKESLKSDVEHAGGKFVSFEEKSDHFVVKYSVDSQQYTSRVSKNTEHSILTAGICLSGEDSKFDLKSLITVMREGQHQGRIYRLNNV
jgi:hypothetical protein